MSKKKVQISIIDFMPQFRKHETGVVDKEGTPLCYGDMVQDSRGENHFVAYRYGSHVLKQPNTMHYLSLSNESNVVRQNIFGTATDYLIVGYEDEPFIKSISELSL